MASGERRALPQRGKQCKVWRNVMPGRRGNATRGRSFGGGVRRTTEWIGASWALQDVAANSSALVVSFTAAQLIDHIPFTITRVVGMWMTAIDAGFVTDQDYFACLGGTVLLERARAGGIVPRPFTDLGDDNWFLHAMSGAYLEEVLTSEAASVTSQMIHFDSRAQRKVEDGDAISFIVENAVGGDTMQTSGAFRLLCKLH